MNAGVMARRWVMPLGVLTLLCIWVVFSYLKTTQAMVDIWWRSGTFNHAFLVPPITLWLIWRKRHELAAYTPRADARFLVLLACAGFAWLMGELAAINVVTQFSMVAMLVLCVPTLFGWNLTRAIVFPLAFLFFAVPFGEFVMPRMMIYTADFTVLALKLTGIPVYREGLHFMIPSGSWSVVEACSGIRYLIASIVVGTLYAYLNYASLRKRLIFIGVSIVVPLIANWLRAYLIVLLGHLSGNRLAVGVDHIIYGWVFFGLVIMGVFMIGLKWADPLKDFDAKTTVTPDAGKVRQGALLVVALLAAFVVYAPVALFARVDAGQGGAGPESIAAVQPAGEWRPAASLDTDWIPAYKNPSSEWRAEYERDGQRVGLYIGYYRNQSFSRKLISSDNVLVKSKDPFWIQIPQGMQKLNLPNGPLTVPATELRGNDHRRLWVLDWYWINGRWVSSPAIAKFDIALDKLRFKGDDSALVVAYVYEEGSPADARQALLSFVEGESDRIGKALTDTASSH